MLLLEALMTSPSALVAAQVVRRAVQVRCYDGDAVWGVVAGQVWSMAAEGRVVFEAGTM